MKEEDFRLTIRDIIRKRNPSDTCVSTENNRIRQLTAVIFLQSVLRGCLARRRVQRIREKGYGQETATMFFLLQVEYWCEHLYNYQKTSGEKKSRSRSSSTSTQSQDPEMTRNEEQCLIEEKLLANDMLDIL